MSDLSGPSFWKNSLLPRVPRAPLSTPFQHLLMDFIHLPLSMDYQYVPVIARMFARWIKAFPCCKTDTLKVAKKLLESVLPTWGIPSTVSSD